MWAVTGWVIATWLRVTLALTATVVASWLALGAHSGAFWLICLAAGLAELLPVPPAPARVGPRSPPRLLVVAPMTRRTPAQGGLWGRQQPLPTTSLPGSGRRPVVNDLDLVTSVIRSATEPGYVVIGVNERVYLRDPHRTGFVTTVPRYEADTVAQLLDTGHLKLGGTHVVSDGQHEGPARSVLIPAPTRAMLARWAALAPLPHRTPDRGAP